MSQTTSRRRASLILFGTAAFLALGTSRDTPKHPAGTVGMLYMYGGSYRMATTESDQEMFMDLRRADDAKGIAKMTKEGRLFLIENGRAEVLARSSDSQKNFIRVRLLSGADKGKVGWVYNAALRE